MIKSQPVSVFIKLIQPERYLAVKALFLAGLVSLLEVATNCLMMPFIQIMDGGKFIDNSLPILLKNLINIYNKIPNKYQLLGIIISFLFISVIKNIFLYFSNISINDLQLRCGKKIRQTCVGRFLGLEVSYYNKANLGELLSYVNEQAQRSEYLSANIIQIAREIIIITALLILLISLSIKLTLITTISLIVIGFFIKIVIKKVQFYGVKSAKNIEAFSSLVTEIIRGIRVIKSFGLEYSELEQAKKSLQKRYEAELTAYKYNSAVVPLTETTGISVLLLVLFIGSSLLPSSRGTNLPFLFTYTLTLLRMIPRINQINGLRSQLALLSGSLESIYNFLSFTEGLHLSNGQQKYKSLSSGIAFENVTFTFASNLEPTLQNVSFSVKQGTTTAIVGPSGSGKSTLADLVMRFHDPDSGCIKIDGVDLKEFQVSSWRKTIAMVSQDTFLFNTSVGENIAYGCPGATNLEIIEAAKKAYAYAFIQELPDGFDTMVGDSGTRLSGGQRQRIAIARAILRNPDILILDEATSALDSNSEQIVQKAIEEVSCDRTVIVIAHRLSTIEKADNIIVLSDGRIVDQGTHQQLLANRKLYWSLDKLQACEHQSNL